MITINSTSIIVPNEPTPNGILWLSESDQMMQSTHEPLISIYKPDTNYHNFLSEAMKNSLSHAFVYYYPLANEMSEQNMVAMRPFSRYEAVAGHIWRSTSKARGGDSCQPTRVRIAVDVRNRVRPPLPQAYFGNAVIVTATSTCLYGDLLSKPLSYSAYVIREAAERMTDDEYIRSAIDLMTSQEQAGSLRINFNVRGNTDEASFPGNPNLVIASWNKLPLYDADFGWGKPIYVGPGMLTVEGKSLIMPSPDNDGSLIIALCLQTQYMDSFKKFFYEDII